jgi:hypothetical protein
MLETKPTGTAKPSPQLDAIAITCPPLPGGGLLLQPNFKACGTWSSNAPMAQLQILCTFAGSNGAVNMNANGTWSATFNIQNPPVNGSLQAVLKDNGVQTAQATVNNLRVVANGGGTCNC